MRDSSDPTPTTDRTITVVVTPILAIVHFAGGSWLSFVLFGLAGGIEAEGRWTRYGGIEYAWTNLAWLPGGFLIAVDEQLVGAGLLLMLAGSGAAGLMTASVLSRLVVGVRPRFGRLRWRLWVVLALWVVWVPIPATGTVTYWHTVAY
jgi:hypothetical protein